MLLESFAQNHPPSVLELQGFCLHFFLENFQSFKCYLKVFGIFRKYSCAVWGMWVYFHSSTWGKQFLSTICYRGGFFCSECFWHLCKNQVSTLCGFTSRVPVLCYCSLCLLFFSSHALFFFWSCSSIWNWRFWYL